MDVDSFARWGKGAKGANKGKKGGKGSAASAAHSKGSAKGQTASTDKNKEVECWNCGKKGHRSAECWSKPRAQANPAAAAAAHPKGGGKSKPQKGGHAGRGKGANSLEEQAHDGDVQQPALAGSLELGAFGSDGVAGAYRSPHLDPQGWLRWTYDTGAAITAFPVDACMGTETEPNAANYKTASGELIPDQGGLCVRGLSESGHGIVLEGRKADVHKPLVSAGMVAKKGHVVVLDNDGGYILPRGGKLTQRIQQLIRAEVWKEKLAVPLYKENGTYVGYMKVPVEYMKMNTSASQRTTPLCPVSRTSPGGSVSGGSRRPQA